MPNNPRPVLYVAWYSPEQWKHLKRQAVDAHLLDDNYEEWLTGANQFLANLKQERKTFIKYFVDVKELKAWCEEQELPNNGASRSQYVAEMAKSHGGG